jgi:hypothetical protein
MTHHYAIAALWSSTDTRCQINAESTCDHDGRKGADACDTCRYGGEPLDREFGVEDIAPETMAEFRSDCEAFYESCADDLADMEAGQAGHDFWLTRNGHGAGFWDRGLGDRGERLSEMARPFGSVDLFVTAEGTVSGQ